MKKILSFILTVVLLCVGVVYTSTAAESPLIFASEATGFPEGEVTVLINVKNNPGVIAMGISVEYDHSVLELKSASEKDFLGLSFGPLTAEKFRITWDIP